MKTKPFITESAELTLKNPPTMPNKSFLYFTCVTAVFMVSVTVDHYMSQPKAQPVSMAAKRTVSKNKMDASLATPKPPEKIFDENKDFIDSIGKDNVGIREEAKKNPATLALQVAIYRTLEKNGTLANRGIASQREILAKIDSLLRKTPDTVFVHWHTRDTITRDIVPIPTDKRINIILGKNKTLSYFSDTTYYLLGQDRIINTTFKKAGD